jgi:hypothetical protein
MSAKNSYNPVTTSVPVAKYDGIDTPIPRKNTAHVAICRLTSKSVKAFPENLPGERVSLDPKQAAWMAKRGLLILEVSWVSPLEIKEAGGIEAYLTKNPKKDRISKDVRRKLQPIPGLPDEPELPPWEFEEVDKG